MTKKKTELKKPTPKKAAPGKIGPTKKKASGKKKKPEKVETIPIPRNLYEKVVQNLASQLYHIEDQKAHLDMLIVYTELIAVGGLVDLPDPPPLPEAVQPDEE